MSLARKAAEGIFWVSFLNILLKMINFIISVVLARLLEPEYFGLIAIAFIFINFFDMFREMGMGAALIYKKDNVDKAANTAFFLFPIFGAVFYIVSYFIAPLAADFFNEPQIETVIRVLSFVLFISSLWVLPNNILDKRLEFKKKVIPLTLPRIGYGITAIWLAIHGFGVWSLVFGWLVLQVLSAFTLWYVVDWRPSYKFDRNIAYELITYGRQVVGADVIIFFISIIDVTFIGRFLGAEDLGFYTIALSTGGILTSQISSIILKVMFPIYSAIQNNREASLKKIYIRTIKYVSLISIPATLGLSIVAGDFIKVVYGDKWLPAIAALQVLCFYELNKTFLNTTQVLYLAAGKPELRTKLYSLQLILMAVLMYPLTLYYGILGASIAAIVPSTMILFPTFREAGKIIEERPTYIIRPLLPIIIGSLFMVSGIEILYYILPFINPILRLTSSVILGSIIYFTFLWLTQKELIIEIKRLIWRE